MTIEELKVIINGETTGLKNAIRDVQHEINGLSGSVTNQARKINSVLKTSIKSITGSFKSLASTIKKALSVALFAGLSRAAITLASDIEEVQNVVDVAFGDMASQVEFFAKRVASAFGLSELQAKRAASTYMSMSKAMGINAETSKTMALQTAALTGDMASFYNVSQDIADTALKSIWTGETETLKRFGIVMTEANLEAYRLAEGIKTSYKEMSQAEKVALRYNFVMTQTAQAQGDFARTSGSWANQLRILRMRWEELLSAMGVVLTHVLLPIIKALNIILGQLVSVAKGFAAIFAPSKEQKEIESNKGGFGGVSDAIDDATESAKKYKRTIFGFDELNVLKEPPSSSGDAGAGGGFDMDIKEPYDFNALAGSMDAAKAGLQDMIDMFNKGVATLDEYILKYADTIAKAGKTIGEGFNKLVEGINFSSIGKTIGDGINAIVGFLNNLLSTIDFRNLGEQFANAVNSIFTTVKWEEIGKYIALKFNALWETIAGFVSKLDFKTIGESFATAINSAFANLNLDAVHEAIVKTVNGIITIFKTVVDNCDIQGMVATFTHLIARIISDIDIQALGESLNKAIVGIIHGLTLPDDAGMTLARQLGISLREGLKALNPVEIFKEFMSAIDDVLTEFFSGLFGSDTLGALTAKLLEFGTVFVKIAGFIAHAVSAGTTFIAMWKMSGLGEYIASIWTSFEVATGFSTTFGEKVSMVFKDIKKHVGGVHTAFTGFFDTMNTKFKTIPDKLTAFDAGVKAAFTNAGTHIKTFCTNIPTMLSKFGSGLVNTMKTVGNAFLHPIATVGKLGGALKGLFAVMAANPFTAFVVIVGTIAAAFIHAYQTSDEFKARVNDLYNRAIKPFIDGVKNLLGDLWNNHLKPIAEKLFMGNDSILKSLMTIIGEVLDVIANLVMSVAEVMLPAFSDAFLMALDVVKPVLETIIDIAGNVLGAFQGLLEFIAGVFTGDMTKALGGIKKLFENVFGGIGKLIKNVVNIGIGALNGLIKGVGSAINFVIRCINKLSFNIPDWVPVVGGKRFGFNIKEVRLPQIPTLADGGVLYDSTLVNAGEYPGAKHNPEIVAPQDIMRDTMQEAMLPMLNNFLAMGNKIVRAIEDKDMDVYMDTTKVTRKVTREQKNQAKYSSNSLVLV